jgi:hypothetical protein
VLKGSRASPSGGYREFKCPLCKQDHQVPSNGFAINETLLSLQRIKPVDAHKADMFKRVSDLLKLLQISIDDLGGIEHQLQTSFLDYYDLIKREINSSVESFVEQLKHYKDKLIKEVDYLKEQAYELINDLFAKDGHLNQLKMVCDQKRAEWCLCVRKMSTNNAKDELKINSIINEASMLNARLDDTRLFLSNTLNRKLIFNQREESCLAEQAQSIIGQLDFNSQFDCNDHKLKIKHLNKLAKMRTIRLDPSALRTTSCLVPLPNRKILNISKTSYDEFADIYMSVFDFNGLKLHEHLERGECVLNAAAAHSNYIMLSVTESKTERNLLKLFNNSLQLISSCVCDCKCTDIFMNDKYVYVKLSAYPYAYKFDYNLVKMKLFDEYNNEKSNKELFVSFVVDRLIGFSNSDRVYFHDECFSRLKIYSLENGSLLDSLGVEGLRESLVRVHSSQCEDNLICLNANEKSIRLFDENGQFLTENYICDSIKNISAFYVTKDGCYIFVDFLNDCVYIY